MKITVKLFATFRAGRFSEQERACGDACTPAQLLAELAIAEKDIGVLLVNGKHLSPADPLSDGDTVSIFPLLGGG